MNALHHSSASFFFQVFGVKQKHIHISIINKVLLLIAVVVVFDYSQKTADMAKDTWKHCVTVQLT